MFQPSAVQTNTPPAIDSSKTQEHTPSSQTTVPLSQLLSLKQYKFAVPVEQGILNCILCDRKQSVTDWLDHCKQYFCSKLTILSLALFYHR